MRHQLSRDVPLHNGVIKKGTPVEILASYKDGYGILLGTVQTKGGLEIHGLVATAIEPCNPNQDNLLMNQLHSGQ